MYFYCRESNFDLLQRGKDVIEKYKLTKEFFKHRKVFEADGVTIQEIPDDDIPFGLMNPDENDPYSHLFDYESESDLEFSEEEDSSETSDDTDSEDSSEMSDDDDYDEEEDKNNALESAEDGSKKDFVIAGKKLLFFSLF